MWWRRRRYGGGVVATDEAKYIRRLGVTSSKAPKHQPLLTLLFPKAKYIFLSQGKRICQNNLCYLRYFKYY